METPADKHLSDAKAHVIESITALASLVINQCEGAKDYTPEYREKLKKNLNALIEVRDSWE